MNLAKACLRRLKSKSNTWKKKTLIYWYCQLWRSSKLRSFNSVVYRCFGKPYFANQRRKKVRSASLAESDSKQQRYNTESQVDCISGIRLNATGTTPPPPGLKAVKLKWNPILLPASNRGKRRKFRRPWCSRVCASLSRSRELEGIWSFCPGQRRTWRRGRNWWALHYVIKVNKLGIECPEQPNRVVIEKKWAVVWPFYKPKPQGLKFAWVQVAPAQQSVLCWQKKEIRKSADTIIWQ